MLFPTVSREWNGVYIAGQLVGLRLQPDTEGTISITITGFPTTTGFDEPCRLWPHEDTPQFVPGEIKVHDTRLECFASDPYSRMLRIGFTLELEPGMAPLIRTWLVKLEAVAAASKGIADKFSAQLPPPIYHMLGAITSVVARILLDAWDSKHSVAYEKEHGTWAREREFMTQFDAEEVTRDLRCLRAIPAPNYQVRDQGDFIGLTSTLAGMVSPGTLP